LHTSSIIAISCLFYRGGAQVYHSHFRSSYNKERSSIKSHNSNRDFKIEIEINERAKESKMNTSQFMDKQIMDLMNHQPKPQPQAEESSTRINGDNSTTKEEIPASYDFHPIRTVGSSPPRTSSGTSTVTAPGSLPAWGSFFSGTEPSNLNVMQCFHFAFPIPLSFPFPFQAFWLCDIFVCQVVWNQMCSSV
jgi:hypothetical protein